MLYMYFGIYDIMGIIKETNLKYTLRPVMLKPLNKCRLHKSSRTSKTLEAKGRGYERMTNNVNHIGDYVGQPNGIIVKISR